MSAQPIKRARLPRSHSPHARLFGTGELSPPTRCAVVVAHPGDEIVGAGCLLAKLTDVTVVHVTNGADEHRSLAPPASEEPATREEECLKALALANVSKDEVTSFGVPYSEAHLFLTELTKRISLFMQQSGADIIVTHPYEGGHPDHDATAFATHAALRLMERNGFRPPVLFEMALHPGEDGVSKVPEFLWFGEGNVTTLLLDERATKLKQQMFACFESQKQSMLASPLGPEKFRQPGDYDFSAVPPAAGSYYSSFGASSVRTEWPALMSRALAQLFPN
jgi:LmbE family N-acetylglucosaminyl deacetylase